MFGKSYIDELLKTKNATAFVEGIGNDPKRFFTEAGKDPQKAIQKMAGVLDLAHHSLGQTALLLGLTGALKVAAKDPRAPAGATRIAEHLISALTQAVKKAQS